MAASKLAILIQNLHSYPASRESNIELLILVSDFMGNSMLKILKGTSMKCMECLDEDKKKKGQILYDQIARDDQIATSAKLLDIMHESYGFNADLIEASY